ncbi:MFS transporter, partial [Frankia sp. AvcI1]
AAAPSIELELAALVLVGGTSVAFISTGNATVQLSADPAMRGRVIALWSVAFLGTTPFGGPIAGWVAQTFGPRAGLLLAAGAALAAAAFAFASLRPAASPRAAAIQAQPQPGTGEGDRLPLDGRST